MARLHLFHPQHVFQVCVKKTCRRHRISDAFRPAGLSTSVFKLGAGGNLYLQQLIRSFVHSQFCQGNIAHGTMNCPNSILPSSIDSRIHTLSYLTAVLRATQNLRSVSTTNSTRSKEHDTSSCKVLSRFCPIQKHLYQSQRATLDSCTWRHDRAWWKIERSYLP